MLTINLLQVLQNSLTIILYPQQNAGCDIAFTLLPLFCHSVFNMGIFEACVNNFDDTEYPCITPRSMGNFLLALLKVTKAVELL